MRRLTLTVGLVAALAGLAWWTGRRPRPDPRLRHALVTGGSRGLGFAIARELLARGVRVSICGRDEATLERARKKLAPSGAIQAFRADLAEPEEADRLLREAREAQGPVDLLVNNAAVIQVGPLETTTPEDYEKTLRINLMAPIRLVLSVLPAMRERRFGILVNIGSVGGRVSAPHLLPYNVSKFGLVGFSEGLRAELAGSGVRVTTVCPGLTRTGSPRHAEFQGRPREEHAWFAVSDALPIVSADARRTARRVVDAALGGKADLTTTLPARLGIPLHGLFPGLTADLMGIANRLLLPRADDSASGPRRGRASRSRWAPSALTRLGDRAARDLNQEPGEATGEGKRGSEGGGSRTARAR